MRWCSATERLGTLPASAMAAMWTPASIWLMTFIRAPTPGASPSRKTVAEIASSTGAAFASGGASGPAVTFAVQGNMIDMAVGMIIGAAFKDLVNSLVSDMVMPVIGLFTGKLDFSNMFFYSSRIQF